MHNISELSEALLLVVGQMFSLGSVMGNDRKKFSTSLRRRKLHIERYEPRQVMAAYISEIHYDPLFGSAAEDQYIELRGTPNEILENGTYLVVVSATEGLYELGDVHAIFDLSRAQFGANGMLVLMESGGGYAVNPQANLLKGADGFRGIGNEIFTADSNAKQIRVGSNDFFLIQSSAPPTLSTDIDADDNGVPDGAYTTWNVWDSVGVLPFYQSAWPQKSYAQIVFREQNVGVVATGNTSVITDQLAYVARVDRSTGFAPSDWVAGTTVELDPKPSWKFQLQHGSYGAARPYAYGGRMLDNVGSENWVGAISGKIFQDDNKDGVQQPGEAGVPGVSVRASLSGEPNAGVEVSSINPDDYASGSDLSNISPYMTMISASATNVPQGFKIRPVQRAFSPAGDYIFAHEGVGFFYEDRRLRMDFYHPAQGVSIDVIGDSDLKPTYGRLEIFNSANQSLGFIRTQPLGAGQKQRLSLTSNNDIAWALAYSDNTYLSSSSFGMFENLELIVPEKVSVTDANGNYSLPSLPNATYNLNAVPPALYDNVFPNGQGQHVVALSGNETVRSKNFGVQGNRPPVLDDQSYSVSELAASGTVIATLPVVNGYPVQRLKYTITAGDPAGLFSIDAASGKLSLSTAGLDFETRPSIPLTVKLEDTGNSALNDTALIQLLVEDKNEAPVVAGGSVSISELTTDGMNVTTMTAVDPDAGQAGVLSWSFVSGNVGNTFAIDSDTGKVTVQDASKIDFEQLASYSLIVRATDKGTPALSGQATLSISITDINEAPSILAQALTIKENSLSGAVAGTVTASDPDRNQSLQWQIMGGSGSSLFVITPTTGEVRLASSAQLNFEQTTQYQLEIKVTDSGTPQLSVTRTISVLVADDNDAPILGNVSFSMAENSAAGELVGTVQATDEDPLQTLQYTLSGPDATNFVLNSSNGQLRTAVGTQFNFEVKNLYKVTVTATDNSEIPRSVDATVTINLTNVNEAPLITTVKLDVPENSAPGSKPGSLAAQDEDAGDVLHWSIVSQSQNWVTINELTGELTVVTGADINFEGNKDNLLSVRVTDTAGASATSTVTLSATDRNDPPVSATSTLGSVTVKADQLFSYTLPAGTFSDPDVGDQLNIFVTLGNGFPIPSWLNYNSATRVLSGTPTASDAATLAIKFTAIDQGGASASAGLDVTVDGNLFPWHNSTVPLDVSGDGLVTARDALLVINYLNTIGPRGVPNTAPTDGYLDTTADNSISARDALLVINDLNQRAAGEGEQIVDVETFGVLRRRHSSV